MIPALSQLITRMGSNTVLQFKMADAKEQHIHPKFFIKLEKTTFRTRALFQTEFGDEVVHHANKISVLFKV
jgi:hypothetical protein